MKDLRFKSIFVFSIFFFILSTISSSAFALTSWIIDNTTTAPVNNFLLNISWTNSTGPVGTDATDYQLNNITFNITNTTGSLSLVYIAASSSSNVTGLTFNSSGTATSTLVIWGNATQNTTQTAAWFVFNISAPQAGVYEITIIEEYSNGTAPGTEPFVTNTSTLLLTINKGTPTISIVISPTNSTTYPTTTTATASFSAGDTGANITLLRNGTLVNSSTTSNSVTETILLGAGTYNYTVWYVESANYSSAQSDNITTVNRGDPSTFINLFIDNQTSDKAIVYPAIAEIRGNVSAIQGANDLIFNLYRNNLLIGSGNSTNQTVDTTKLGNATYTFVYNTTGGANWTSGSSPTRKLYVLKGIVPLILAINGTEAPQTFTYENITNVTGWSEVTGEDLTFNLYRDGVQIASGSPASEIIRLGAGTYTYVFNTSGGSNYTSNSTSLTLTINPKTINIYLALNGTQANRTYTYPEAVNATAWKDSTINNEGSLTLLRDGVSKGSGQVVTEEVLLGAGTYNYSVTFSAVNYTANNITNRFALVNKGTPTLKTYIDFGPINKTVIYPDTVTVQGNTTDTLTLPIFNLYVGPFSASGSFANLTNIRLGAGIYNVVYNTSGNANWTAASNSTLYVIVNKGILLLSITHPQRVGCQAQTTVTGTQSSTGDNDVTYELWRDNIRVAYGLNLDQTEKNILEPGSHTYRFNATEGTNYTANSTGVTTTVAVDACPPPRTTVSSSITPVKPVKGLAYINFIKENEQATVQFEKRIDLNVFEISIAVKNRVNFVSILFTKLDQKPSEVAVEATGKLYSYFDVKRENIRDEDISKAKIKFFVEKSWIDANKIDENTIALQRFSDNKWNKLTTTKLSEDKDYVYYEAETPGFSYFAISGEVKAAPAAVCGNGICESGENNANCPADCPTVCTENWSCTEWGECINGVQTRTCTDINNCGTTKNKPATSQSCVPVAPAIPLTVWIAIVIVVVIVVGAIAMLKIRKII
jgi:PGF-pre-PGF domain-containing protein